MAHSKKVQAPDRKSLVLASSLGAIIIALASCVAFVVLHRAYGNRAQRLLDSRAEKAAAAISGALVEKKALLIGVRGLFDSSELVEKDEFSSFVRAAQGTGLHPGVVSVAHLRSVPAAELAAFEAEMQFTEPGFRVHDLDGTDPHQVYTFLEPYNPSSAKLGFDATSVPARRYAMERSLVTGEPTLTEPVMLIDDGRPGFIMFLPVFRKGAAIDTSQAREEARMGFVETSFDSQEFFGKAMPSMEFTQDLIGLEVYDVESGREEGLFESRTLIQDEVQGSLRAEHDIEVASRRWKVVLEALPAHGLTSGEKSVPYLVLLGGLAIAAAYYAVMRTFARSYGIAVTLAEKMTKDMRVQNEVLAKEKSSGDEARSKLETLIENLPIGVYIVRAPGGEPELVNATAVALLGRGVLDTVDKRSYIDTYHVLKEDGTPFPLDQLPVSVTLATGEPDTKSGVIVERPNGERVALHIKSAPIFDQKGKMTSVVSVFSDMTAEFEVDKQKSEFVFVASHQLRTPLTAVRWFIELLQDKRTGPLTPEQNDFLRQAKISNERMIALVNELLNVSRIESGSIAVEPVEIDLTTLVSEAIAEVRPMIEKKKLRLAYGVPKLPKIKVDPKLLRQAFLNLLSNAAKYTSIGGEIGITAEVRYKDVLFTVFDTGMGIPLIAQKDLFRKFFRGGNAMMSDAEGTGLGLYVCKEIIELSGGRIWFESTEGAGTRFYFTLPLEGSPARPGFKSLT